MESARPPGRIVHGLIFAASLAAIGAVILPLWKPLLLAAVLAGTLMGVEEGLAVHLGARRRLAAALLTIAVIVLILAPLAGISALILRQAMASAAFVRDTLRQEGLPGLIEVLPDRLRHLVGRGLEVFPSGLEQISEKLAGALGQVLGATSRLALQTALMLIAFYFMLTDGRRLLAWAARVSPLPEGQTLALLRELRAVARSVLRSVVATAAVQGAAATVGYLIAGVPQPFFFGMLTFFAAFVPSVGTAIVALPLAGLWLLLGHRWAALFLALWSLLVVGLVDNLIKPWLVKGEMRLHGAVVFFALVGGLLAFGPIGLVVGPLAVTFFLAMLRLGRPPACDMPGQL